METSSEWLVHPWVTQGAGRVRFGVMGGPLNDWPRLSAFVARVEELGFDSYWTIDHPLRGADWATNLAALAVTTPSLRLGTLVACVYYRNPIVLARYFIVRLLEDDTETLQLLARHVVPHLDPQ